jgi:hypothetical protein
LSYGEDVSQSQPFGRQIYKVEFDGPQSPAEYAKDGLPPVKGATINTSRGKMIVLEVKKPAGPFGQTGLILARLAESEG